ncbi:MAG: hypothetical protein ACD_44C00251G0003 [uncultured bacterium]|nr:MAG: hypothetical protein ACD_44C00251G0003 [uncultured bacterium]OGT14980.1 MAG: phosphoglycerate dehydrogenase [Gammaproteobacteria bacterium RIFCSPHIGHO2_02_FULL_38_33]OGT24146.1 MAG: phosphoglycerate dehydrogenase [Gammaproteobacteria bacterium RIFCSPHIGHO2_12_38_15]OGT67370.1 MAG: phosphoglycerate dehydrogenase [Gammaproteobacteria bacterium RIFCSPLOWO2_02_FULL_38_11]
MLKNRIAVTSRSFSRHPLLRQKLLSYHKSVTFNNEGKTLCGDELAAFLAGHEKAIIALEKIDEALLKKLPDLKVISKFGVGLDAIDREALKKRNIHLSYTPGVNKRSVSELTLLLILSLLRKLVVLNLKLTQGGWEQQKGNCLTGKCVGIVGCGQVGKDLISLISPFECQIYYYDLQQNLDLQNKIQFLSLEDLLMHSDIVSLHLPLCDTTKNILNADRLALMKPDALLINTSRGGLVDEQALKERLKKGLLASAAFDVFAVEPPQDTELLNLPRFLGTPHIGGSTEEAILAMGYAAVEGLKINVN